MPRRLLTAFCLLTTGFAALYLGGCQIGLPFRGPGFDREHGVLDADAGDQALVVITHGVVSQGRGGDFRRRLKRVLQGMPDHEGLIGFSVRRELFGKQVWTVSAWTDEKALEAFVYSDSHVTAMAEGTVPSGAFRSVRVKLPVEELPLSWDRARRLLEETKTQEVGIAP